MIADKELDRKTLNDTVDSQTGNTVSRFLDGIAFHNSFVAAPDVCCYRE